MCLYVPSVLGSTGDYTEIRGKRLLTIGFINCVQLINEQAAAGFYYTMIINHYKTHNPITHQILGIIDVLTAAISY